jgi:hypothetical protein
LGFFEHFGLSHKLFAGFASGIRHFLKILQGQQACTPCDRATLPIDKTTPTMSTSDGFY